MAIENEGQEPEELENDEEEGQSEPEPQVPQDQNEPIEVVTDEAKRESRKARRAERQNEFRRAQEEAARLRAENEQLRRQPQYQPQHQPQQQPNPAAQRLQQIDEAKSRLNREYQALHQAGRMTPELQTQFEREAEAIQTAKMAAIVEARSPQLNEQEIIRKAAWHQFTTENADVFHDPNPKVQQWAWAEYYRRIAEGHADTKEMVEEVLDQCRMKFGKTPRKLRGSKPDQATKQRFSGIPSKAAGPSTAADGTIKMGPHEKRMARIAFGDKKDDKGKPWSEAKMYQHWANTVGKKMQQKTG